MQIKQGENINSGARLLKTEMADRSIGLSRAFPIRLHGHSMGRLLPENEKWNTFLSNADFLKHESLFWR
jgi:hypothetical protein